MDIRITGSHFDVTEAMRKHVLGKLERVNRHADNIISTNVTLSVDKLDRVILKHNEKSNDPRAIPIPVPAAE